MDTETIGEDDWNELQKNLEATIPVYDKINRFATLGQVSKWRRKVRERLPEEGLILEVGCGPGLHSKFLSSTFLKENSLLVSTDISTEMLKLFQEEFNKKDD